MPDKEDLIVKIVDIEWKLFQKVPNMGGKAVCQEDFGTFKINRYGQALSWSEATLASYLDDLTSAEKQGRNLLTEKYAYMMKSTAPQEYAQMEHLLPAPGPEASALIEEVVDVILSWEEDIKAKYPYIAKRGRPIYTSEDNQYVTSIETYLWGELATYSLKTLQHYRENVLKLKSDNINGSEITLTYVMQQYGFKSLEEANERLK